MAESFLAFATNSSINVIPEDMFQRLTGWLKSLLKNFAFNKAVRASILIALFPHCYDRFLLPSRLNKTTFVQWVPFVLEDHPRQLSLIIIIFSFERSAWTAKNSNQLYQIRRIYLITVCFFFKLVNHRHLSVVIEGFFVSQFWQASAIVQKL